MKEFFWRWSNYKNYNEARLFQTLLSRKWKTHVLQLIHFDNHWEFACLSQNVHNDKKDNKKIYDKSSKSFMRIFLVSKLFGQSKILQFLALHFKMDAMVCCGECLEGEILVSSKTSSNLLSVCWFSLWCLLGFEAMASTNSCVAFLKMLFFKAQACMAAEQLFSAKFSHTHR